MARGPSCQAWALVFSILKGICFLVFGNVAGRLVAEGLPCRLSDKPHSVHHALSSLLTFFPE